MESDKRYFLEGLFVVAFTIAAALFSLWVVKAGHRGDVTYRIYFTESVSGLALGDPVKFNGVDVGTVRAMQVDPDDPRRVRVDVRLRKEAPVKTDTKAVLRLKGLAGTTFVELNGGSANATRLADATPAGKVPEIASEKSDLATLIEQLPRVLGRLTALESKAGKVMSDVGDVAERAKENPILNFGRSKQGREKEREEAKK